MSVERIGPVGPLVLRYTTDKGTTIYRPFGNLDRFECHPDGGWIVAADKEVFVLSGKESQQVAAQLDMLIDPPILRAKEDVPLGPGDAWGKALGTNYLKQYGTFTKEQE